MSSVKHTLYNFNSECFRLRYTLLQTVVNFLLYEITLALVTSSKTLRRDLSKYEKQLERLLNQKTVGGFAFSIG